MSQLLGRHLCLFLLAAGGLDCQTASCSPLQWMWVKMWLKLSAGCPLIAARVSSSLTPGFLFIPRLAGLAPESLCPTGRPAERGKFRVFWPSGSSGFCQAVLALPEQRVDLCREIFFCGAAPDTPAEGVAGTVDSSRSHSRAWLLLCRMLLILS